jgi:hypothetical protein
MYSILVYISNMLYIVKSPTRFNATVLSSGGLNLVRTSYFAKVTKFLKLHINIISSDRSLQDYTHKTVQTVYTAATKQATFTCYKY